MTVSTGVTTQTWLLFSDDLQGQVLEPQSEDPMIDWFQIKARTCQFLVEGVVWSFVEHVQRGEILWYMAFSGWIRRRWCMRFDVWGYPFCKESGLQRAKCIFQSRTCSSLNYNPELQYRLKHNTLLSNPFKLRLSLGLKVVLAYVAGIWSNRLGHNNHVSTHFLSKFY